MNAIVERVKREPALVLGLVGAVIALLLAFGLDLTNEQQAGITGLVIAILAFVTRSQVTPNRAVGAAQEDRDPGGDLVAGEASELTTGTPVDVIPAVDVYGDDEARHAKPSEQGAFDTGWLIAAACVVVIVVGLVWLARAF